ncbi:hypothetical protein A3L12_00275 [Thermococcus sp. P6]|uniref:hypothetical protein n=1 Tax=Thermococcus sp. P6 TaxID=122420 RepID=UPI000B59A622|nr:hypothetical protein [Thermococcus sp. P6]ASJ09848.1 hypothetical protein A3L12_00275 [Thermococcus sp. P6]
MIRERVCRKYLEEIERLERSLRELEDQLTEVKMQLRLKVDEANRLAIENANLRHRLEVQRRTYNRMVELLKEIKFPIILLNDDDE